VGLALAAVGMCISLRLRNVGATGSLQLDAAGVD
jgi:hypothetical protein